MRFEKITGKISEFFSKERIEQIGKFIAKAEAIMEVGNPIADGIDKASERIKANTEPLCELIGIEKLDLEFLKQIVNETKLEGAKFVALLDEGRNAKDKLEIFLQYLDGNKEAVDVNKVICIRCDMKSQQLKEAFGDKKLLIINI
ncbi:hypothetical protein CAPN004_22710 [Capnocytophaga cynodegmi]|uniref:hypothetical protein n=1 Tax=Capnocytophaga cynodegmi TaxID=28189 RepID=UPI001AC6EA61|nr:hypothetical protein [Capnocytophaga cynodegmi]GIM53241.1 hypothetical protein CAPN004_22710 [Capnocytophaga cynodegmi]